MVWFLFYKFETYQNWDHKEESNVFFENLPTIATNKVVRDQETENIVGVCTIYIFFFSLFLPVWRHSEPKAISTKWCMRAPCRQKSESQEAPLLAKDLNMLNYS